MSEPDYAEQYERLKRELAERGLLRVDEMPDPPELSMRYGCRAWLIGYVACGFLGFSIVHLFLGLLESHAVVFGVGVAAAIPGVLVGRPALRRLRAKWAAENRFVEWSARQPGGRAELRARYRRAAITASVGIAGLLAYHLAVEPLVALIAVVGTVVILLPFVPHIRRQTRWYRELTAEPGTGHRRVRGQRRRRAR